MKKALLITVAAFAMTACTDKQANDNEGQTKSLVIYYSQTGATQKVANILAEQTGADIDSIVAVNPYNGTFEETIARCQEEQQKGELTEIKELSHDIANYDTLYVGTPVWFGTMAPPMASFIKKANLEGKVIIPFVTFGSGGLETTVADMKKSQTKATFAEGYGVRNARIDKAAAEVEQFLIDSNIKEGKASVAPNFGEQKALTDAEKAIFDEACGDYQMPLGTPVTVASAKIGSRMSYIFVTDNKDKDGNTTQAQIHVSKEEGAKAEFTKVVR